MKDRAFLEWCAARLVLNGDSPHVDFVGKLCSIARALPIAQDTANTGADTDQLQRLHEVEDRFLEGRRTNEHRR